MAQRLRSDFWVSAYLRRCAGAGAFAALRRRGAAEAGAIFVKIDCLDGTVRLFAPASPSDDHSGGMDRRFVKVMDGQDASAIEERMKREARFDSDLWFIEVEDREGRSFLDEMSEAD